ncbi:capsule assembly protein Wzi [Christiangramia gaetbulicola]|uniref:Capsule assembly protein Wzi n=1 Tax=Christiangramia gaetbulicola TaxID=703340 RepID=A0A2T6AKW8_9FLAO|nr:capsule assembly Wzi family protein [Christiangramia gaetbulicola]PTX44471.1 capsule assembly protein Wzi [Christiangramia gaetbulicola]
MRFKLIFSLVFFTASKIVFAQADFSGSVNLEGYFSSEDDLPFWFYSNQRGRVSEDTNIDGWINGRLKYSLSDNSNLEIGGGIFYQDAFSDEVFLDELYANFQYKWLQVIAGRKHEPELYNGLSATNENILWSLNSRPLFGLQIQTNEPVYFSTNKKIGLVFAWEDYYQNDHEFSNRFTHHKKLQLILNFSESFTLQGGIQHFAQWGGTSERFGDQPESIKDYLRIVGGRAGGETAVQGDQENALGNHLGSWELYLTKRLKQSDIKFIYNSIFEDGSGSRLANFPDGRYGLFWRSYEEKKLVNSLIYEYYNTRDQSKDVNAWGADNYFNSGFYTRGWAFNGKVFGSPLFTYDPETSKVINNKFNAHHIGIGGQFSNHSQNFPYKLLLTYRHNEGTFRELLNPEGLDEDVFNFYSKWRVLNLPVQADLSFGFDLNSMEKPVFGAGISLSRQF